MLYMKREEMEEQLKGDLISVEWREMRVRCVPEDRLSEVTMTARRHLSAGQTPAASLTTHLGFAVACVCVCVTECLT